MIYDSGWLLELDAIHVNTSQSQIPVIVKNQPHYITKSFWNNCPEFIGKYNNLIFIRDGSVRLYCE